MLDEIGLHIDIVGDGDDHRENGAKTWTLDAGSWMNHDCWEDMDAMV